MTTKQNIWVNVSFDLESRLGGALDGEWRSVDEIAQVFAGAFEEAKAAGVQRVRIYVEVFDCNQERQLSDEEQVEWTMRVQARREDTIRAQIAYHEAELAKLKGGGQ